MTGWDGAGSLHAVRLRAAKLDTDGSVLVGSASQIVTDTLMKISFTVTKSEGTEVEQKNGSDQVCLYYKAADTIKGIELKMEICKPDPDLEEFLQGGTVLTASGASIGYAAPAVGAEANPNGVSIEAWSHAIIGGAIASVKPYIHWVFPRTQWLTDGPTLENGPFVDAFTGVGRENTGWDDGPAGDWAFESSRLWQWARVASGDLPDVTSGPVAVS